SSSRNQGRRKGGVTVRTKQQQQQQQHTATLKSSPLAYTGGAGRLTLVMTKPAHDDARTSRNRAEDSHPGRGGESSKSPPTRTARHISKQTARAIIGAGGHAMLRGWNGFEEELKQNCVGREGRDTMHYA
ncbi:unnamed protein product, partial [Sphacelaria rigidula]